MKIVCQATRDFNCGPEPIFELMVDAGSFPACFTGYGLIPAIRKVRLVEPLAVGVIRHIYNADNSVLTEQVTVLEKPHRHAYTLSGFQAPFSWLVKKGESDWQLKKQGNASHVRWTYEFTLTSFLLYPVCYVLLKFFMQRAMQRCLKNMTEFCDSTLNTD
ncbi:MAG: SRPBCC family protein [Methylococcales bacterium]